MASRPCMRHDHYGIGSCPQCEDEQACGLCGRVTDESCVICEACEDEPLELLRLVRSQRDAARRRARAWKALAKRLWSERRGERQMRLRAEAQKSMRMTLEEHHEAITEARADERRRVCEEIWDRMVDGNESPLDAIDSAREGSDE